MIKATVEGNKTEKIKVTGKCVEVLAELGAINAHVIDSICEASDIPPKEIAKTLFSATNAFYDNALNKEDGNDE